MNEKQKVKLWKSINYPLGIFLFLFFSLFAIVEYSNAKLDTNDFKVYYEATVDFFKGNNPYVHSYGLSTGYFKYTPFTLYLFRVFAVLPYGIAQFLHLTVLFLSLFLSLTFLRELAYKGKSIDKKPSPWIFYLVFLTFAIHLVREFHMGNINMYLMFLLVLGLRFVDTKRGAWSAFFWSLMLILKPIMILAMIPLLFYGKWQVIIKMAGFGILFFLFPALFVGLSKNGELWNNWLQSISKHGEYLISENSLSYLCNYYLGIQSNWIPSLFCLAMLLGLLAFQRYKKKVDDFFMKWTVLLAALVPNFFLTDTEHFLLAIPLVYLLIHELSTSKNIYYWVFFAIGMFLFSFNSTDLWGRELSDQLSQVGILGIGNLIFLTIFMLLAVRNQTRNG